MTEPTVTEKEAVLRERQAFLDGRWAEIEKDIPLVADRYPLPKVKVPRVFLAPNGVRYRVIGGQLEHLGTKSPHWTTAPSECTRAVYAAFLDLFDHPTEEVSP